MENYIDFKQERDFGDILNAGFQFIKQNYKQLGKFLFILVIPFILINGIITVSFQVSIEDLASFSGNPANMFSFIGEFLLLYFLLIIFMLVAHTMLINVTYSYIKLYINKKSNDISFTELKEEVGRNFFKTLGTLIVFGLLISIGAVMCFLPAIYLGVSLSLLFFILIYENTSFGNAFSRSFSLTHKQWWITFLLLLVVFLIIIVIMMILSVPSSIYNYTTTFNSLSDGNYPKPDIIQIIIQIVVSVVSTLLGVIPGIIMAFQYFNITEKHESTALMEEVESIE